MRNIENDLFSAIEKNASFETIKELLEMNVNFYAKNENNKTAIMLAAGLKPEERAMEICELLLAYGGKEQICTYRKENENFITPFHDARDVGNEEVAKMLLGQIFSD